MPKTVSFSFPSKPKTAFKNEIRMCLCFGFAKTLRNTRSCFWVREYTISNILKNISFRGGEWYLEKRGFRKILVGSRNLESIFDQSRSLVLAWFVFTFLESRNFLPKSLGLRFLTRISASRRVSDFTIRHPFIWFFFFRIFE